MGRSQVRAQPPPAIVVSYGVRQLDVQAEIVSDHDRVRAAFRQEVNRGVLQSPQDKPAADARILGSLGAGHLAGRLLLTKQRSSRCQARGIVIRRGAFEPGVASGQQGRSPWELQSQDRRGRR